VTAGAFLGLGEDVTRLQAAYEHAEQLTDEAAEAERKAFERWQEAMGAYEVARDESDAAWHQYAAAVGG
jgi:hypothetical protein